MRLLLYKNLQIFEMYFKNIKTLFTLSILVIVQIVFCCSKSIGQDAGGTLYNLKINWNKVETVSKTELTIQVCPEPPLRRGHPASKNIYKALQNAKVNLARLQPWYPFPRLGVAELEPPKDGKTSWDFSVIDPIVIDFFKAAEGRPVMVNFSTIPQWMIKTDQPVRYPSNPNEIAWDYSPGNELRDSTMKELVDYFHRLVSWYTKGGFTDEYGKYHHSGYHFKIDYWEVLNENDDSNQHLLNPEQYTKIYDAVVEDLHKLDPEMKFSGLSLSNAGWAPKYFEYFLNPKNHKPGVPVDMVSYHFYAQTGGLWLTGEELKKQQFSYFESADGFFKNVLKLDSIRQRLAPQVKTYINELGSLAAGDALDPKAPPIPDFYWNVSGAMFAYLYPQLIKTGIDYIGIAELIDYPGQYAGATIVNWETGMPNARYQVFKLLHTNFGVNTKMVESGPMERGFLYQGFITPKGVKKILLVNKGSEVISVEVPGSNGATIEYVDYSTGDKPAAFRKLIKSKVTLQPHAVAVITLKG